MATRYSIARARPEHVDFLPEVERAAAALFEGLSPDSVLEDTTDLEDFREAQAAGQLWVALADDVPCGFALVEVLADGSLHLEEMDVSPAHGRRGLGTALLATVKEWAAAEGHQTLTLTTFRHVRWNMPFYARHGFREVPRESLSTELRAIVADEATRELVPARRVVMRCELAD